MDADQVQAADVDEGQKLDRRCDERQDYPISLVSQSLAAQEFGLCRNPEIIVCLCYGDALHVYRRVHEREYVSLKEVSMVLCR